MNTKREYFRINLVTWKVKNRLKIAVITIIIFLVASCAITYASPKFPKELEYLKNWVPKTFMTWIEEGKYYILYYMIDPKDPRNRGVLVRIMKKERGAWIPDEVVIFWKIENERLKLVYQGNGYCFNCVTL